MISTIQNTPLQLGRLAAQRQLYATAKRLFAIQCVLGGVIAPVSAVLGLQAPQLKVYIAAWGVAATLLEAVVLSHWIQRLKTSAAGVQEAFDCDVLALQWNSIKGAPRPEPELIQDQAERYHRRCKGMPPLTNWYSPAFDSLPPHLARIACQRSNCSWDAKQRRWYAACVAATLLAVVTVVIFLSLHAMTMEGFFINLVAPLMPAFSLGIRQYKDNTESAGRLERLQEQSNSLWKDALAGGSPDYLALRSRALQDEIYESRRKSPLVFDWIFKRLRPRYQRQMGYAAETLVAEAQAAGLSRPIPSP